jgi:hypothetical protein
MKKKLQRIKLRKCETCLNFRPVKFKGALYAGCNERGKVVDAGAKLATFERGNCPDYEVNG